MVRLDRPDPLVGLDIHIAARYLAGAPFGMKVVCQLLHPLLTASSQPPNGKIVETLGDPGRPDVAIRAIIRQYELADAFPPAVIAEADRYPVNPPLDEIERELAAGRTDLRGMRLITIDGEDARDLDDAVSLERLNEQCFRLGVHLADVSHYVPENGILDLEARRRGTSVYLADRVLPMLPPRLSNGLCSLNPHVDRLALSVFLVIDSKGEILDGQIDRTVIRSAARTSYQEVYLALTEDQVEPDRYPEFLDDLRQMQQLANRLHKRRRQLGGIDFNLAETKIDLDDNGVPVSAYPEPHTFANDIIEAFMIAANEYIANFAAAHKLPIIYRVHDRPDPDKLDCFLELASVYGLRSKRPSRPSAKDLALLLDQSSSELYGPALSELLLRSMAKAEYSAENIGHFGLASLHYCHFTSPIRRYPDLFVHRTVKRYLDSPLNETQKSTRTAAAAIAEWSSITERQAMMAERDSVKQKAVEYMNRHLGETFGGMISGFSNAGMIVQLESTIEGMVLYRSLDGYIAFDEKRMQARNESSGRVYSLGDQVVVQVARADVTARQIDFTLMTHHGQRGSGQGRKTGGKGRRRKRFKS
ncbi:MAG: VacB/RNase II family 3'-5' exoribonuclease [Clostridiaceae bacterium]|nr:VacB/RNase II family 3'-5' exoribonuclease [Clostridiaceae bacterium]